MRVVGIDPRSMVARLSSTSRTAKRHDCSTQLTCRLWGSAQRNELTCWHCAIGSGRINPTMLPSNGRKRCPTGLELLIQVRPCRWHSRSSHHLPRNPRDICRARGLEKKASIARQRQRRRTADRVTVISRCTSFVRAPQRSRTRRGRAHRSDRPHPARLKTAFPWISPGWCSCGHRDCRSMTM